MSQITIAKRVWTSEGHVQSGLRRRPTIITATAELHHFHGNSGPHFSITMHEEYKNPGNMIDSWISAGCQHDRVAKLFPHLKQYIPFHLCAVGHGPLHYVANTIYHLKRRQVEYARSSSLWGVLPDDEERVEAGLEEIAHQIAKGNDHIEDWFKAILVDRLPHLNEKFEQAMIELFGADVIERCQPYVRR